MNPSIKYIADAIIEEAATRKGNSLDAVFNVYAVEMEVMEHLIKWMKETREEERSR